MVARIALPTAVQWMGLLAPTREIMRMLRSGSCLSI